MIDAEGAAGPGGSTAPPAPGPSPTTRGPVSRLTAWLRSGPARTAWPRVTDPRTRRLLAIEVVVLLCATFGLSGLSSILDLVRSLLAAGALSDQTATLNSSASSLGWVDAAYQALRVLRLAAWTALPLVMLAHTGIRPAALGLAWPRGPRGRSFPWRGLRQGLALAAVIGLPGLAWYLGAVALGINLHVAASGLTETWWRPIALVASAVANGAAEEVLVTAYLVVRLRSLGWSAPAVVACSALLRGSYHLYQGFGGGLGNAAMGVLFALWFLRTRRVGPLIVAHATLDIVAFLGYALLAGHVGFL